MAKRGNRSGSLYWDKRRKRWIALVYDWTGNRRSVTTVLPKDARVKEQRDTLAKLVERYGTPPKEAPAAPQTVTTYLEQWNAASHVAETSRYRRARLIIYCITPHIGHKLLGDVTPADVAAMLHTLGSGELPYSPRTVQEVRGFLGTALRDAVRHGLIERNPVELVRGRMPPKRHYPLLTPEQFDWLRDTASHDRQGAVIVLGLTTGIRIGEAMGLRWSDLDEQARTLRIDRTVNNLANAQVRITVPKTASSRRVVIVPASTIAVLQRHRAWQAEQRLAMGEAWQEHGLIFPDSRGNLARSQNLGGDVLERLGKAGKLPHLRFHDLRHNCASHLLANGVPLQVVSELLGHANPGITQNLYGHLLEGMKKQAADAMDRLFSPVASTVASRDGESG